MSKRVLARISQISTLKKPKGYLRNLGTSRKSEMSSNKPLQIGTHDGAFHCDEALACSMLQTLEKFKDSVVVRTRVPEKLDACNIVVDVGAVFDHDKLRYDHHQREFVHTFNSLDSTKKWVTKLSSAGLIYVFYGRQVIKALIDEMVQDMAKSYNPSTDDSLLELIYDQVYENFIEEIDAVDNGIAVADGAPRYMVTTTISRRVAALIPAWNEPSDDEILLKQFHKAMDLVGSELKAKVQYFAFTWLPAHDLVKQQVVSRKNIHDSGEVIYLENGAAPWKDHIYSIEDELGIVGQIKYVLYTDMTKKWRIQCVPVRSGSFENRLSFPAAWCGLRDEKLSEVAGIEKCIFVHTNGFIGGNWTYEGALQMVDKSLKMRD